MNYMDMLPTVIVEKIMDMVADMWESCKNRCILDDLSDKIARRGCAVGTIIAFATDGSPLRVSILGGTVRPRTKCITSSIGKMRFTWMAVTKTTRTSIEKKKIPHKLITRHLS